MQRVRAGFIERLALSDLANSPEILRTLGRALLEDLRAALTSGARTKRRRERDQSTICCALCMLAHVANQKATSGIIEQLGLVLEPSAKIRRIEKDEPDDPDGDGEAVLAASGCPRRQRLRGHRDRP